MTPIEAIEKEIEREEEELKSLDKEAEDLTGKMTDAAGNTDFDMVRKLSELLRRLMNGKQEIEGKKLALAAVKAKPNDPAGAIQAEYDAEHKKADELGRKAQELREKIFKEHRGEPIPEETARKLKEMNDEFDEELARLRGKSIALGAVRAASKPN